VSVTGRSSIIFSCSSVVAAAVIFVDAMLLSVLMGFAVQVRRYLLARLAEIPGLASMNVSFALIARAAIAYADPNR
jgi:hypothetical protein